MSRTFACLLSVAFCSSFAFTQLTAIKAGRLIDPDTGTVLNDQVILVRDNRVAAVGKGLSIPAGAKVIDLSKMTRSRN